MFKNRLQRIRQLKTSFYTDTCVPQASRPHPEEVNLLPGAVAPDNSPGNSIFNSIKNLVLQQHKGALKYDNGFIANILLRRTVKSSKIGQRFPELRMHNIVGVLIHSVHTLHIA